MSHKGNRNAPHRPEECEAIHYEERQTQERKVMSENNSSTYAGLTQEIIEEYRAKGWKILTALPKGEKKPPLIRNTGAKPYRHRLAATAAFEWEDYHNLGLVLATDDNADFDIIAIDIDDYGNKEGADNLAALMEELGELNLNGVPRSTRRGGASRSFQTFWKVPKGKSWVKGVCVDVDVIQPNHRYSVVYPSVADQQQYRWLLGAEEAAIPSVNDLPWLPESWLEHLLIGEAEGAEAKAPERAYKEAMAWLEDRVLDGEAQPITITREKGSRHDDMVSKMHGLVQGAVFDGEPGLIASLEELEKRFQEAKPEAKDTDFPKALIGEVAKVEGTIAKGAPDVNWRVFREELGNLEDWVINLKDRNGEPLELSPNIVTLIKNKLTHTGEGEVKSTPKNYRIIIEETPAFQSICLNQHSGRIEVLQPKELPWNSNGTQFDSRDFKLLRQTIGEDYGISSKDGTENALEMVANKRSYHPIKDYFDRIVWDGKARLDTLFIDNLDAEDNIYSREATAKIFIAAVARTFAPGTKFDQMLVLVGKQGAGKSTILKKMGKQWFTDQLSVTHMKDSKKAGEQTEGKLIVEVQEMAGLRKAEAEVVKSYISSEVDRFRAAYGGNAEDRPRQAVLFGTTNESSGFLLDTTGNRRFWPIHVGATNADRVFALTDSDIDQVWAEAVHRYHAGESINLGKKAAELALGAQSDALEDDERAGLIEHYLNREPNRSKEGGNADLTCGLEVWIHALHGTRDQFNGTVPKEMKRLLMQIEGWEATGKLQRLGSYGRQQTFRRIK